MHYLLRLTITNSGSAGAGLSCEFGESGGTIGRSQDNDFVLPDPEHFLSRKHASISYDNGTFYITDTSENGVFVNAADDPLGRNNRVALRDGDRLDVGELELEVSITAAADSISPEQLQPGASPPASSPWDAGHDTGDTPGILDGSSTGALKGGSYADSGHASTAGAAGTESDHLSSEQAFFRPPPVKADTAEQDWDKTSFGAAPAESAGEADWDKTSFGAAPVENAGAAAWDKTEFAAPVKAGQQPAAGDSVDIDLAAEEMQQPEEAMTALNPEAGLDVAGLQQPAASGLKQQPAAVSRPAGPATTGAMDAFLAFCSGAGLDPKQIPAEDATEIMRIQGRLYREIVEGMMEVLRSRFDLKSEFRMQQTQIRQVENNPLKFIGQLDEALEYMVHKRSAGFLEPEAAFTEAFQDIKDHQIAMVVGMRSAFDALLGRFDPERLEQRFTKGDNIVNMVALSRKANCWDRYYEWYKDICAAADDDFQDLFGSEFTRAYEEQISRLSLIKNKPRK